MHTHTIDEKMILRIQDIPKFNQLRNSVRKITLKFRNKSHFLKRVLLLENNFTAIVRSLHTHIYIYISVINLLSV